MNKPFYTKLDSDMVKEIYDGDYKGKEYDMNKENLMPEFFLIIKDVQNND